MTRDINMRCWAALCLIALSAPAESHVFHYSGLENVKAVSGPLCPYFKVPSVEFDLVVSDAPGGAVDGYFVEKTGEGHSVTSSPTHVHGAHLGVLRLDPIGQSDPGRPLLSLSHLGSHSMTALVADPTTFAVKICSTIRTEIKLMRIDDGLAVETLNKARKTFQYDRRGGQLSSLWAKRDFGAALPVAHQLLAMTEARDGALKDRKPDALMDIVLTQLAIGHQDNTLLLLKEATTLTNADATRRANGITWASNSAKTIGVAAQFEALLHQALSRDEAATPNNLAAYEMAMAELTITNRAAEALQWAQRAAARMAPEEPALVPARNEMGAAFIGLGRYAEAYAQIQQAVEQTERQGSPSPTQLQMLADSASLLGRFDLAVESSRRACALAEDNGWNEPFQYVSVCEDLANMLYGQRRYADAEPVLGKMLAIAQILEPKTVEHARILESLGRNLVGQERFEQAEPLLQKALSIYDSHEGSDTRVVALASLGDVELHEGHTDAAKAHYLRAYLKEREEQSSTIWRYETDLMAFYGDPQVAQPALAIYYGKLAVNQLQSLRAGLSNDHQSSFVHSVDFVYHYLADLLITQGRLGEAQQVITMLREQELFNFTQRDATTDPRKTTLTMSAEENKATESEPLLVSDLAELRELKAKTGSSPTDPQIQERLATLQRRIQINQAIYVDALANLSRVMTKGSGPSMEDVRSLGMSFRDTLKTLGHDSVMIQYLVLPDKLVILMTTTDAPIVRNVNISQAELYRQIAAYRETLNLRADPLPQAQQLYGELIAPIAGDLEQLHAKVLMLSLDDALRYLPFGALHDGKRYLIERYALATVTLAATQHITLPARPDWKVWGLGVTKAHDVTFGDPDHLQNFHFAALGGVAPELEGIAGAAGILPGTVLLDSNFNKDSLARGLSSDFPVIHIASHFKFAPGDDSNSFLLLGDGPLSLADLESTFDFGNVDLLTLSACETALGDGTRAGGGEVESFSGMVLHQGTHAVLATLWSVEDSSTALLMRTLYQARQKFHMTKADALRTAQLALLHGSQNRSGGDRNVRGFGGPEDQHATEHSQTDPNAPFAHPYYWAAFVLTGNWL
jgi:CHAT domain-containing protein